jgi:hypothetical protein
MVGIPDVTQPDRNLFCRPGGKGQTQGQNQEDQDT